MTRVLKGCAALLLTMLCYGCGHMNVSSVGLLSVGDLEGKTIPATVDGPVLVGKDYMRLFDEAFSDDPYYLSDAVRNALKGTVYDTLVDVEVTTRTSGFWWSNEIEVKGKGLDSRTLSRVGGVK